MHCTCYCCNQLHSPWNIPDCPTCRIVTPSRCDVADYAVLKCEYRYKVRPVISRAGVWYVALLSEDGQLLNSGDRNPIVMCELIDRLPRWTYRPHNACTGVQREPIGVAKCVLYDHLFDYDSFNFDRPETSQLPKTAMSGCETRSFNCRLL